MKKTLVAMAISLTFAAAILNGSAVIGSPIWR